MGCSCSKPTEPTRPERGPSPELDPDYCPRYYFAGNAEAAAVQSTAFETVFTAAQDGRRLDTALSSVGTLAAPETLANPQTSPISFSPEKNSTLPEIQKLQCEATRSECPAETKVFKEPLMSLPDRTISTSNRPYLADLAESTQGSGSKPAARKVDTSDGLCSTCQKADLTQENSTKNGNEWEPAVIDLGFLDEIVLTHSCSLCRLVTQTLTESWTSIPMRSMEGTRTRCLIPNLHLLQDNPLRTFWELTIIVVLGSGTLPPHCRQKFASVVRLDHLHTTSIAAPSGLTQLAKAIDHRQCDREFISHLLYRCKHVHCSWANKSRTGDTCDKSRGFIQDDELTPSSTDLSPAVLRVIDIENNCIIEAPPSCSFVALSYVWGRTPFPRLLRKNLDTMSTPNGLSEFALPKTVTEAMQATVLLKQQFLWVDALCIIQDSPSDVSAQIAQMDLVYSSAICTIVAAAGEDAQAGLPGLHVSPRTPQHDGSVKGLLLHSMGPTLQETLQASKWFQRGWTYQEFCLSRRLLFFTDNRVFFSCASDSVSEDVVHEDRVAKRAYWASGGAFQGPRSDFSGDERTKLPSREFGLENPRDAYKIMVQDYSRREFSYDTDVLSGVQGILRLLTLRTKRSYYVCGMPEHRLDTALLWFPVGPTERRGPTKLGHPFPTWAWAGWKGAVAYEAIDFTPVMTQEISEWALDTPDGQTIPLLVDQIPFEKLMYSQRPAAEADHRARQRKDLYTLYESGNLRFKTKRCQFTVNLDPEAVRGHISGHERAQLFPILKWNQNRSGQVMAGALILPREDAAALVENPGQFEEWRNGKTLATFILVSSTQKPHIVTNERGDDVSIYDEDLYEWRGWESFGPEKKKFICNVLWVREEEGVMKRVAVGMIHADAWEESEPKEVDARLG